MHDRAENSCQHPNCRWWENITQVTQNSFQHLTTVITTWKSYIWTAEEDMENDNCSYTHKLSSCKIKAWKKSGPERDSKLWPPRYRCTALLSQRSDVVWMEYGRRILVCHWINAKTVNALRLWNLVMNALAFECYSLSKTAKELVGKSANGLIHSL